VTKAEPVWLEEIDILAIHDRLLAIHGGASGLRDEGLLKSALARPKQLAAYGAKTDIVDWASAYTTGIVKNHPFLDGNKRTGFVAGVLFLELNERRFTAAEDAAAEAVIALAAGALTEAGSTAFLRENLAAG
jgi:death-on-curing protein